MATVAAPFPIPSIETIRENTRPVFNLMPCKFQARVCQLQLEQKHTILVAPTGVGKSITFLMPFIWQREGVCILIGPLQLLGDQHVKHPALGALGIEAIHVTAETASNELFKDIALGRYRLVVTSPEYVEQDYRFRTCLWNSTSFCKSITRVIFDETHCILDWGGFRPSYQRLCFLRPLLPSATFLCLSATLTPGMILELKKELCLYDVEVVRLSTDRPNVIPIVHAMQGTAQSYHNLDFLVPKDSTNTADHLQKFMVFMNSREQCYTAAQHLRARLPPEHKHRIVWVHSDMTSEFNTKALEDLREGRIDGIVCTDVAGMGIDISDILIIVQYLVTDRYCTISQRSGRGARNPNKVAKFVFIVEPKYFDDTKKKRKAEADKRQERKRRKEAAELATPFSVNPDDNDSQDIKPVMEHHLSVTGESSQSAVLVTTGNSEPQGIVPKPATGPRKRNIDTAVDNFINAHLRRSSASGSGLQCRRKAGNDFFTNPSQPPEGSDNYCCTRCCRPPAPPAECCDVCNPALASFLSEMDPPPKITRSTGSTRLEGENTDEWSTTDQGLQETLEIWRDGVAETCWGPHHPIGGIGILSDDQIERLVQLARRGLIPTHESFERELKWHYHKQHGVELLKLVHATYPPPMSILMPVPTSTTQTPGPPESNTTPKAIRQIRCSNCQQIGHNVRSCPRRFKSETHAGSITPVQPLTPAPGPALITPVLACPVVSYMHPPPVTPVQSHLSTTTTTHSTPLHLFGYYSSLPSLSPYLQPNHGYPGPYTPPMYYPPFYSPSTARSTARSSTSAPWERPSDPTPSSAPLFPASLPNHEPPAELVPAATPAAMAFTGAFVNTRPAHRGG